MNVKREMTPITATADVRECASCGCATSWKAARQRTKGTCPDCAGQWYYQPVLPGLEYANLVLDVLDEFPGSSVMTRDYDGPEPGGDADERGPCVACHTPTRRYGPGGHPLCPACWAAAAEVGL